MVKHVFYPNIKPSFNNNHQIIEGFAVNGFHHDEGDFLQKSGMFVYQDKIYGSAEFGAEECYMATVDFGDGIIAQKTFFPPSWPKQKVAQVIFEAAQHRIKDISDPRQKAQKKFLCQGPGKMLVEVMINLQNVIVTGYPSRDNFRI